ncbi:MAG: cupin domain-containing protein [Candidatus Solibacter usitatus]|nr:cupin domain-containing protein [Candidatus Solibacter usitatus]
MKVHQWNESEAEIMSHLVSRQVLHTETMTVARLRLKRGASVPEHHHVNEQISTIVEGSLKFVIEGREIVVRAGESLVIPPNVPHSAVAEEECLAIDMFHPLREDWLRGDDAYLRK